MGTNTKTLSQLDLCQLNTNYSNVGGGGASTEKMPTYDQVVGKPVGYILN